MKIFSKLFVLFILLATFSLTCIGQSYKEEYQELTRKKDNIAQLKLLQRWEKTNPDDPELYVSYFNFYIGKGRQEILNLSTKQSGKESIPLNNSQNDKTFGFINSQIVFEKESLKKAFEYIEKGIVKFPNRLDLRFGKTYILGEAESYQLFTEEIVKAIEFSNVNKNQWFWLDNKPVENPNKFLLSSIQDYVVQLFDAGDDKADFVKDIAETVLKYYPESVENLSNLAIYYMIKEDFDNALIPLLKAEKLVPDDFIVLNNIAWCYYSKGDNKNALKYYDLVMKFGNEDAKAQAKEKIDELRKKVY